MRNLTHPTNRGALIHAEPVGRGHSGWLDAFAARHGRPPAVLHIGNIGNNAYILSGALNAAGLRSDVLVPDDYHIMTCPEWEDADFTGDLGDHFHPAWENVDVGDFTRPRWFVQGPSQTCLRYLVARRSGQAPAVDRLWHDLNQKRMWFCAAMRRQRTLRGALSRLRVRAGRFFDRTVNRFNYLLRQLLPWTRLTPSHAERVAALIAQFHETFPGRQDVLERRDFPIGPAMLDLWRNALDGYDLVVGYSTDGAYPLFVDRPYFAFEHGTIRSIPFEPTGQGRLCALTYRMARHAFITNADNGVAARRLGLANFSFLPHPLNDQEVNAADASALRRELCERLRADFLLFHPARQHWTAERLPSWEKANDSLIEGFARFVHEECPRAAAIFVNWGRTVEASRALLRERGVADRVLWIEPQPNRRLLTYIQATDAVADQFYLGSFGGIMPKALRLGRPCLISLDEERHRWCFPEMPPVLNARTAAEIHAALTGLRRRPDLARRLQTDGPRWYKSYHRLSLVTDCFLHEMGKVVAPWHHLE
jgi:hypothetical protein